jgi:hypothetical protein
LRDALRERPDGADIEDHRADDVAPFQLGEEIGGLHRLSVGHKPSIPNKIKDYLLDYLCCKRLENLNEPTKVMNLKHQYLHGSQIY